MTETEARKNYIKKEIESLRRDERITFEISKDGISTFFSPFIRLMLGREKQWKEIRISASLSFGSVDSRVFEREKRSFSIVAAYNAKELTVVKDLLFSGFYVLQCCSIKEDIAHISLPSHFTFGRNFFRKSARYNKLVKSARVSIHEVSTRSVSCVEEKNPHRSHLHSNTQVRAEPKLKDFSNRIEVSWWLEESSWKNLIFCEPNKQRKFTAEMKKKICLNMKRRME